MFTADRRYIIHWELTDLCNLKCPMCPRTDENQSCQPVKEIIRTQFFLADIKAYFNKAFLRNLAGVDFCGNMGDPCIARDFYKICEYLIEPYGIKIMVSTNGSMHTPEWWKNLGALFSGTNSRIEFHIDGLEGTNHLYRIGADWHKLMANTAAYISTGARADWVFILFKHNQHQVDIARQMARENGFHTFVVVDSGRFPDGGKYHFQHPDGHSAYLEMADPDFRLQSATSRPAVTGFKDETGEKIGSNPAVLSEPPGNRSTANKAITINNITCKASKHNRFYVDARGNVAPCCWVSNNDPENPGNMLTALNMAGRKTDEFNLRHRPLEEILNDPLFSEFFAKLWEEDALSTCRKKCGRKHRNIRATMKL